MIKIIRTCVTSNSIFKIVLGMLFVILALPLSAEANAGVPMIFLSYPVMVIALLPIIVIESGVYSRFINLPLKKNLLPCGVSNAVSTLAGFPLAWGILLGIELLTTGGSCGPGFETLPKSVITALLEAAWICPWEDQLYWMIPNAFIISLIVAFFISLFIEYKITKRFYKDHDRSIIKKAVYKANITSYCLLVLIAVGYLIYGIATKQ